MPVLSAQDREFFDQNGYVIVHDAATPAGVDAAIDAIYRFTGIDRDDRETWYRPPIPPHGIMETYHSQAAWDNRTNPRIHQAFSELFGTEELWVSIDRLGFKPPRSVKHPEYDFTGFTHLDVDTSRQDLPFGVQGALALTDTTTDQGGFQCIPGMHKRVEAWARNEPPERGRFVIPPDIEPTPIPMKAGDLAIWTYYLPHGNGHNRTDRARMAQYMTMWPAHVDDYRRIHWSRYPDLESMRQARIAQWRERRPPEGPDYPGDPTEWDRKNLPAAKLTDLGRKLLGLDVW